MLIRQKLSRITLTCTFLHQHTLHKSMHYYSNHPCCTSIYLQSTYQPINLIFTVETTNVCQGIPKVCIPRFVIILASLSDLASHETPLSNNLLFNCLFSDDTCSWWIRGYYRGVLRLYLLLPLLLLFVSTCNYSTFLLPSVAWLHYWNPLTLRSTSTPSSDIFIPLYAIFFNLEHSHYTTLTLNVITTRHLPLFLFLIVFMHDYL